MSSETRTSPFLKFHRRVRKEVAGERGNLVPPFPEGRNVQADHVEAVEEVVAEVLIA